VWAAILPFAMNTAGWMLTENGRQPWIVQGLMLTANGVSPSASTATVAISLAIFFVVYAVLTVVAVVLMIRYGRKTLPPATEAEEAHTPDPVFVY
jgi:cytochrome d ubiquinol oxidase subunit I